MASGTVEETRDDAAALSPRSLIRRARRLAGPGERVALDGLDGLDRLTAALDGEAELTAAGRAQARNALVRCLETQIRTRRLLAAHPQIDRIPVRPIFITGLLRTGTTFLQNLLAQHPGLRSPRLWELMAPAGPGRAQALAACEAYVAAYDKAAPGFKAIHELSANGPEECHRLTANTFRHPIYALRYRVPSYLSWLGEQSMTPAYAFHRAQLRCLLWRRPGDPVVLKCPSHLWYPDALSQVYPDAVVIRLHRDPAVAVPSVCSLTAAVRSATSDRVDRAEIGRYWLEQATAALSGLRRDGGALRDPPLDIRYTDLVADPLSTVAEICDRVGVPLTARAGQGMSALLAARHRAPPAAHEYSARQFGLTARELDEPFAAYRARFGV